MGLGSLFSWTFPWAGSVISWAQNVMGIYRFKKNVHSTYVSENYNAMNTVLNTPPISY